MIFLQMKNVKPGMILGQPVYLNNQVLLTENSIISAKYISRLNEIGIPGVYIANSLLGDLEIFDVISRETKREAFHLAQQTLTRIKKPQDLTTSVSKKIRRVVHTVIQELLSQKNLTMNLYNIKTFSDYIFDHSVNVCLFSLIIGIARGYNEKKLLQLGVGAFLHDLGKMQIPYEILEKPGRLTQAEFSQVQSHPLHGYHIVKSSEGIDFTSANIIYQHHEKMDGSGYPRKIIGESIHEFARIVSIADIYDAITSNRVYSKAMPNHEAIEIVMTYASNELDADLVNLFLSHIPAFPLGTFVHLNNQSKGVVIGQNEGLTLRPLVMILEEKEQEVSPYTLDLAKELSLVIVDTS